MASVLHVNAITGTTGVGSQAGSPIQMSGDTATLGSGVNAPGHIIQVKQTLKDNEFSTQSTSFVDLTGLNVVITPKFSSSKFLIDVRLRMTNDYYVAHGRLMRDSTELGLASGTTGGGASTNNRSRHLLDVTIEDTLAEQNGVEGTPTALILDSPTIPSTPVAITYKVQVAARFDGSNSSTTFVNRTPRDRDTVSYDHRSISTITVMEVAG